MLISVCTGASSLATPFNVLVRVNGSLFFSCCCVCAYAKELTQFSDC